MSQPTKPTPKRELKNLGIRFDEDVRDALDRAARADKRSASSLVELIVEAYLREKGFLKDGDQ
jgi:predicted transcriptional regulator